MITLFCSTKNPQHHCPSCFQPHNVWVTTLEKAVSCFSVVLDVHKLFWRRLVINYRSNEKINQ